MLAASLSKRGRIDCSDVTIGCLLGVEVLESADNESAEIDEILVILDPTTLSRDLSTFEQDRPMSGLDPSTSRYHGSMPH